MTDDFFKETVVRLLFIIATKDKVGLTDALYLKELQRELFENDY